jgi:hypothetical protein
MKSRAARLALLVMFVVALGVTAYLFRKGEADRRAETTAAEAFSTAARGAARGTLELRAAQQAYVATGQPDDFWASKVAATLGSLRDRLTSPAPRRSRRTPDPKSTRDRILMISRRWIGGRGIRAHRPEGRRLDLIFSNAGELTGAVASSTRRSPRADRAQVAAETLSGVRTLHSSPRRPQRDS